MKSSTIMFPRNVLSNLLLPKIVYYESTRGLRGAVTVPLKIVKSNIQKRKPDISFSNKEFKHMEKENPGIAHKLRRRIDDGYNDVNQYIPADTLEDTEVDMSDYPSLYSDEKRNAEKEFDGRTFHNIKRKHYKEPPLPNMVTYIEKQQMKLLHKQDPEFWSADKLAECFPASTEIVKKILKSSFTAYTVEAVLKHDKTVRKNWDLFQKGKLHFDDELKTHYASFVGRLKLDTNVKEIEKFLPPPPDFNAQITRNDFGSIISSSKKYRLKQEEARKHVEFDDTGHVIYQSNSTPVKVIEEYTTTSPGNYLTLDTFREKMKKLPPANLPEVGQILLEQEPAKQLPCSEAATTTSAAENVYAHLNYSRETGLIDEALNESFFDKKMARYPMRIKIPRHQWKKGKVFRMNDCFYDDNGCFLYRVPGLVF